MSGGIGAWMFLWIILGVAVVVTAGVVVARALGSGRKPEPHQLPQDESPAAVSRAPVK